MWRVIGVLVAVLLALTVIGWVVKALRFLLVVALVIAVIAAAAGGMSRKDR